MFVCHGNICRSPMAEYIMKKLAADAGRDDIICASSATSTEEIWGDIGNPIYPPAKDMMHRRGIPFDEHHAVQLRRSDYAAYDLIIGMDSANIRNIMRITGGDLDGKIHKLLSFAGSSRDVADPWYSGDFSTAFDDIMTGCTALMAKL